MPGCWVCATPATRIMAGRRCCRLCGSSRAGGRCALPHGSFQGRNCIHGLSHRFRTLASIFHPKIVNGAMQSI
jgi:hypothetical protein